MFDKRQKGIIFKIDSGRGEIYNCPLLFIAKERFIPICGESRDLPVSSSWVLE